MEYMTPQEISKKLKISEEKVLQWIKIGIIPAIQLENLIRIKEEDFKEFLKSLTRSDNSFEDIMKTGREKNAYFILVEWLETEIKILTELYRDLERVFEGTVDHIKSHLDGHRKAGEHLYEKQLGNFLLDIYDCWESPRKYYHQWVNKFENRWEDFQRRFPLADEDESLESYFLPGEWPRFYDDHISLNRIPPRYYHHINKTKQYYRKRYYWLKRELDYLVYLFRKLDRSIKKAVKKLYREQKKCSKQLDFKKGYLLQDLITSLYRSLEGPKKKYNFWLMGKEERWNRFKFSFIPKLREIEEKDHRDVLTPLMDIDYSYEESSPDQENNNISLGYNQSIDINQSLDYKQNDSDEHKHMLRKSKPENFDDELEEI
jgi:excisionase family DNA binding protein